MPAVPRTLITIVFKGGTSVELGTPKEEPDLNAILNSAPNGPGGRKWTLPLIAGKERKNGPKDIARTIAESFYFDVNDIFFYSIETLEIVTKLEMLP